jgi:hypothetical protein
VFGQFLAAEAIDELFMTPVAANRWPQGGMQFDQRSYKGRSLCRIVRLGFNCSV